MTFIVAFYLVCSVTLNFELIFIVIFFGYEAWINDVQSIKGFILLLLKTWVQCYPGTTLNYNLRFCVFQPHRYLRILSNYSLGAGKDFPERLWFFMVPLRVKANTDKLLHETFLHIHWRCLGLIWWSLIDAYISDLIAIFLRWTLSFVSSFLCIPLNH